MFLFATNARILFGFRNDLRVNMGSTEEMNRSAELNQKNADPIFLC